LNTGAERALVTSTGVLKEKHLLPRSDWEEDHNTLKRKERVVWGRKEIEWSVSETDEEDVGEKNVEGR